MGLELKGSVSLDGSGFEAGLNKIEAGAHRVGHSLKDLVMEAAGIYTITQAIHKTVEFGEKLVDTSRRIGLSIEALQEFGFAARQNGSDIEALTGFIEKLNTARVNPKKIGAFEKLGVSSVERFLPIEELIMKISANARTRSSAEVVGPLREIGGRGAGSLIPMLKEDLEEVRHEAHKLGVVMRSEDAVALKFLADEMKILSQIILIGLAPAIVFLMEKVMSFVNKTKAAGTFWGDFFEQMKTPGPDVDNPIAPGGGSLDNLKTAWKKLQSSFTHAGAVSEADLKELDEATKKEIKALLDKQKAIEEINTFPDFTDMPGQEREVKPGRIRDSGDSLTRVGNFLGSSRDILQSIGERQIQLLQQIVTNTSTTPHGMGDGVEFPLE